MEIEPDRRSEQQGRCTAPHSPFPIPPFDDAPLLRMSEICAHTKTATMMHRLSARARFILSLSLSLSRSPCIVNDHSNREWRNNRGALHNQILCNREGASFVESVKGRKTMFGASEQRLHGMAGREGGRACQARIGNWLSREINAARDSVPFRSPLPLRRICSRSTTTRACG